MAPMDMYEDPAYDIERLHSFVTSTNMVVCLSFCVFVCYVKTTEWIFMKILPQMYLWTRKNWLNFGTYPLLGHEDMKTEKLQHYNSGDSTTTPLSFTMIRNQTNADNKYKISTPQFMLGGGMQFLTAVVPLVCTLLKLYNNHI